MSYDIVTCIDKLQDDYLEHFGTSKQNKRYQRLKMNITKLKLEYILTSRKLLLNDIKLMERDLTELSTLIFSQDKGLFDKNHVILQKWYGQKIDIKEVTVLEYNHIIKAHEQENRAQRNSRTGRTR